MNAAAHARLALLALSVALFAAVWSGDRRHQSSIASAGSISSAERNTSVRAGSDDSSPLAGLPGAIQAIAADDERNPADDVPLPAALAPGKYRVVGTSGGLRTVRFTADDLLYLGVALARRSAEVPVTDNGVQRWYFIRLENPAPEPPPTTASAATRLPTKDALIAEQPEKDEKSPEGGGDADLY